ncbi:MAG: acetyltransferase [Methylocystaceae bacterium]
MGSKIIIIGGGGHALVLIDSLHSAGEHIYGITENNTEINDIEGIPVLGTDETIMAMASDSIKLINGLGMINLDGRRKQIYSCFRERGYEFCRVIHPTAIISPKAELGSGVQVMAGAVIQTHAQIGSNTIVNTRAVVEHDVSIGSHCHIATGAVICGGVRVGDGTLVGAGATIKQGIKIGSGCLVAAGAMVTDDIMSNTRVKGVPAFKF